MAILLLTAARGVALAGEADVVDVRVMPLDGGLYSFSVTIRSNETGWESYADRFEVLGPDGSILGTRVLQHPHVDEQPFTRSLDGIFVPDGVEHVTVRAHHSQAGYDGETIEVTLPR